MSRPLELPEPIYDALAEAAQASGTTPVGWIVAHLPPSGRRVRDRNAKSLADLFEGRIGRIASGGGETLSENCGERLTDDLERRRGEGRL